MKNFKNFAIYGLPVGSLSNICAMNDIDLNDVFNRVADFVDNKLGGINDLGKLLSELTDVLVNDNKEAGLKLLNKHIFSEPDKKADLSKSGDIYSYSSTKEKGKQADTLFILFHGLGQSVNEYITDIDKIKDKFNADVVLIEYNLNGNKTNTFEDMEKYCEKVADFIKTYLRYKNNIFFGYSLGSFVANLTRQKFNDIKDENVTSKYIGYKGIKDLENAGVSFIKTFTGDVIDEEDVFSILNYFCKTNFENFSDLFKYLLGDEEFEKIKTLTNNARILTETKGFDKEKVVFNDDLATKDHNIDLGKDITPILNLFNNEENNDKDVFLFQCKNGDEVVGKGMADTYYSLTGKEPKHTDPNPKEKINSKEKINEDNKGKESNNKPIQLQEGQEEQLQGGQEEQLQVEQLQKQDNKNEQGDDQKSSSCCGIL